MAKEKQIKSRIINKHDVEANWDKAVNFIPEKGEIIVYDIDSNYSYERFKLGDGVTTAINLPFYLEEELDAVLEKIDYLAENTLEATCEGGVLLFTKGITFPNV